MFLHATKLFGSSSSRWGIRKSVTTQMSSRPEIVGRYLMHYISQENPDSLLYLVWNSWNLAISKWVDEKRHFELWRPSIWRLSFGSSKYLKTGVLPTKTGRLLHLTHVLQCHCCNLFDWIGLDVDFHRDLKKGKIIAPKATATGAGALGCRLAVDELLQ